MDYYSQGNVPSAMGKNPRPGVTVDKVCKLLKSAQPLVWALAIVLGLLGVTLTVRYLWGRKRVQDEERVVSDASIWPQT
ncbi:MAG: hypothetical protein ABSD89_14185 [Halobacteriota archaeon]|jgi:hypothetical protein